MKKYLTQYLKIHLIFWLLFGFVMWCIEANWNLQFLFNGLAACLFGALFISAITYYYLEIWMPNKRTKLMTSEPLILLKEQGFTASEYGYTAMKDDYLIVIVYRRFSVGRIHGHCIAVNLPIISAKTKSAAFYEIEQIYGLYIC